MNAVTAASVETPGPTYSTTSRAKVSLQVFPVKISSEDGLSLMLQRKRYLTLGVETFLSKAIFNNLSFKLATVTLWLNTNCRASPQLRLVKPIVKRKQSYPSN